MEINIYKHKNARRATVVVVGDKYVSGRRARRERSRRQERFAFRSLLVTLPFPVRFGRSMVPTNRKGPWLSRTLSIVTKPRHSSRPLSNTNENSKSRPVVGRGPRVPPRAHAAPRPSLPFSRKYSRQDRMWPRFGCNGLSERCHETALRISTESRRISLRLVVQAPDSSSSRLQARRRCVFSCDSIEYEYSLYSVIFPRRDPKEGIFAAAAAAAAATMATIRERGRERERERKL